MRKGRPLDLSSEDNYEGDSDILMMMLNFAVCVISGSQRNYSVLLW